VSRPLTRQAELSMDQGINFYETFARLEEAIRSDAQFLENETHHFSARVFP
jgi:hypothetical protein